MPIISFYIFCFYNISSPALHRSTSAHSFNYGYMRHLIHQICLLARHLSNSIMRLNTPATTSERNIPQWSVFPQFPHLQADSAHC